MRRGLTGRLGLPAPLGAESKRGDPKAAPLSLLGNLVDPWPSNQRWTATADEPLNIGGQ